MCHKSLTSCSVWILQCRKRLHPLLVSVGDANVQCKRAIIPETELKTSNIGPIWGCTISQYLENVICFRQ